MDTLLQEGQTPQSLSPLTLAFVGDGVYELLVREHLVAQGNCPVRKLHSRKVELVRCQAQAKALESLWPVLSEEERDVALRGRNAHVGHAPKTQLWRTITGPRPWKPCSGTCIWQEEGSACGNCLPRSLKC